MKTITMSEFKESDIEVGDVIRHKYSLYEVYNVKDDQVAVSDDIGAFWIDLAMIDTVWKKKLKIKEWF